MCVCVLESIPSGNALNVTVCASRQSEEGEGERPTTDCSLSVCWFGDIYFTIYIFFVSQHSVAKSLRCHHTRAVVCFYLFLLVFFTVCVCVSAICPFIFVVVVIHRNLTNFVFRFVGVVINFHFCVHTDSGVFARVCAYVREFVCNFEFTRHAGHSQF